MAHIKIVATIGPATCDRQSLLALYRAGVSVARLNGAHADPDWHRAAIKLIRSTLPGLPILLDLPGRKIRTSSLAYELAFAAGDTIAFTTDTSHDGRTKVPVSYSELHVDVKAGDIILADDGTLRFKIERVEGRDIICRADTSGVLRSHKGINVPFVKVRSAIVSERDRQMVRLARELDVDFIGVSFVESAAHVAMIRDMVQSSTPQILAKIENQSGIDNLDEILGAADAVMIDRGDLSVETSLDTLVFHQKRIIQRARETGKPVIVATEMLSSMIDNDFPLKAEVTDIANAVLDGCSAIMLSGETAIGRFPLAAVQIMRRIADAACQQLMTRRQTEKFLGPTPSQAIEDAIASILQSLPVTKVVAITRAGYAARMLSARMVAQPIFAVSDDYLLARSFNIYSGVEGVYCDTKFPRGGIDHIKACLHKLYDLGKLDSNDLILVTGLAYPRSGTRMNLIQIHQVADLVGQFGWETMSSTGNSP